MTYYPSVKESPARTYPSFSQHSTQKNQPSIVRLNAPSSLADLANHILRQENLDQVTVYLSSRFGKQAVSQFQPEQGLGSAIQQFPCLGLTVLYENNQPRVISFKKQFLRQYHQVLNSNTDILAQLRQQDIGFINLGSVVITTLGLTTDAITHHASNNGAVMCSYFFKPIDQQLILEETIYHDLLNR